MKTTLLVFLVLFCGDTGNAKIIKVPQDYAFVQLAINAAANSDTVLVSEGTYSENLKITKKITLASFYLMDKDTSHISKTILDGDTFSNHDSLSVILILPGTDSSTIIKGLTIQHGRGTRVIFTILGVQSTYRIGGGIAVMANGGATISSNIIKDNSCGVAGFAAPWAAGGGIAIMPDVNVTIAPSPWIIEYNTIMNNSVSTLSNSAGGGGLCISGRGRVTNNTIMNNSASAPLYGIGGGINIYGAPGEQNIELTNNLIKANEANYLGGGIEMHANIGLGSPAVTLRNNIIVTNYCVKNGAAVGLNGGSYSLVNNTIAYNFGDFETISLEISSGPLALRLMNNIIWNPVILDEFNTTSGVTSKYNCVRNGMTGTGNIKTDPLYDVANDPLYRLSAASPCVSAGTMSAEVGDSVLSAPSFDFLGKNRPRPSNTKPDLGAIEHDSGKVTAIRQRNGDEIPTSCSLSQNYPNPFNPTTTVRFTIPDVRFVTMRVYDMLGREVATLVNEEKTAGSYEVTFNPKNLSSGIYFCTLQTHQNSGQRHNLVSRQDEDFAQTIRLQLLK